MATSMLSAASLTFSDWRSYDATKRKRVSLIFLHCSVKFYYRGRQLLKNIWKWWTGKKLLMTTVLNNYQYFMCIVHLLLGCCSSVTDSCNIARKRQLICYVIRSLHTCWIWFNDNYRCQRRKWLNFLFNAKFRLKLLLEKVYINIYNFFKIRSSSFWI